MSTFKNAIFGLFANDGIPHVEEQKKNESVMLEMDNMQSRLSRAEEMEKACKQSLGGRKWCSQREDRCGNLGA